MFYQVFKEVDLIYEKFLVRERRIGTTKGLSVYVKECVSLTSYSKQLT